MNFPLFIAKRYFSTKQNRNFVHIISWVSLAGVSIGTAALILVLSVFNGFENLILMMYNSFDPHIKITLNDGKTFSLHDINIKHDAILEQAFVLEEDVLLRYQEKEFIATVKGVSENYKALAGFDSLLVHGSYIDSYENDNVAVVGRGVAYYLSMGLGTMFDQLKIYVPDRNARTLLNPTTAFKKGSVLPIGVFGIQAEIDERFIITPLSFIQALSDREGQISAVELQLNDEKRMIEVQEYLKEELGNRFVVKNRLEQQEFLYKILNTEKLAVFLILAFIMIIATFNIIGSLSMLMLDKKKDIQTFRNLGSKSSDVQRIFFNKSMLTVISGTAIGLVIGLLLAFLQKTFSFIGMGGGNFVVEAYPVTIKIEDVFLVSITVLIIGIIASWYPSKVLTSKLLRN